MFDIIFEIIFTTVGYSIGKTIIPVITLGKVRVMTSEIENSMKKTRKKQLKWYGVKISNTPYLSIELTGAMGVIILTGIIISASLSIFSGKKI